MKVYVDWQDHAKNAAPEERATVADLRILVDGNNVCDNVIGEGRDLKAHVTVSAYPAAEGIALNWWRIFGRRGEDEFRLVERRDGYVLPDVRMRFDGTMFECQALPRRYRDVPVWFPRQSSELLTRHEAESDLSDFVERVAERLADRGVRESALQLRWERIGISRGNADEAAFCEAAGALRCDPYDIAEEDAAFIEAAGTLFRGEALVEFLSGLHRPAPEPVLDWIRKTERRPPHRSRLPGAADIRNRLLQKGDSELRESERAWARGYRCARAARKTLGIDETVRLRTVGALAGRLEAPSFRPVGTRIQGLRALVRSDEDGVNVHVRSAQHPGHGAQLFALGRALGDAVANPPLGLSVVNDLRDASRQAASRAFAAEFLAPVSEIRSMREDNWDTETMAEEFGVAPAVIERQIENRDNIERACAA